VLELIVIFGKSRVFFDAMSRKIDASLPDDPLRTIASPQPYFTAAGARAILNAHYGLDGRLDSLVSERDQNYRLTLPDGRQFVLKIANSTEPQIVTDFQIQALLHIEDKQCPVATPRIVRTRDDAVATTVANNSDVHVCRLLTYLPGSPPDDAAIGPALARNIGASLAAIDIALCDFEHAGDSQALLWDLQRALEVRPLLANIQDKALHETISSCLADFEDDALYRLRALPRQVIHGDLNTGNVLVAEHDAASIAGIIDFGDMVRAPRIADLAIAASYLRSGADDPLTLIASLVAGYQEASPLTHDEAALLFDLVRVRLATSVVMLHWRVSARGEDDPYRQASLASEADAAGFFHTLGRCGRRLFTERMLQLTVDC